MLFEVVNELTLKITMQAGEYAHMKSGSMIAFQGNLKFDKELLGPGRNVIGKAASQFLRRFTGENLPLMKATANAPSESYFAFNANHVVVLNLAAGERIAVESENILGFEPSCEYGVMFLSTGVVSQKGLATSTITGPGQCAILVDGNPIILKGSSVVDPDAMVAFTGNQPTMGVDLNWKNFIGQSSGESYNLKFTDPNNIVIIQPNERQSGINFGMDGGSNGQRAYTPQTGLGDLLGGLLG